MSDAIKQLVNSFDGGESRDKEPAVALENDITLADEQIELEEILIPLDGTLRQLIRQAQEATSECLPYDLQDPPDIEKPTLKRLLRAIEAVPALPESWHRVQEILQSADASASDLGGCVSQDSVLSAKMLKLGNSAAYAGTGAMLSNMSLTVARMGFEAAGDIVMKFLAPELGGGGSSRVEVQHIWFHNLAVSTISRVLAEPFGGLDRHEISMIGMLHDIGKLVVLYIEPQEAVEELGKKIEAGYSELKAEHEIFGYTHLDAGMMLALHWKLPRYVQQSILFHHHAGQYGVSIIPEQMRFAMMIVHLAHLFLQSCLQSDNRSCYNIWDGHMRRCMPDAEEFLEQELLLPLDSKPFFEQMQGEVERLKGGFPELFPADEE